MAISPVFSYPPFFEQNETYSNLLKGIQKKIFMGYRVLINLKLMRQTVSFALIEALAKLIFRILSVKEETRVF